MFGARLARLLRRRRSAAVLLLVLAVTLLQLYTYAQQKSASTSPTPSSTDSGDVLADTSQQTRLAEEVLAELSVKGRAAKTGYKRTQFSDGWASIGGCDVRNLILQRDMQEIVLIDENCKVKSGILEDPYTGKTINFSRGEQTSDDVQIDHVVALSDAWQKGAQLLDSAARYRLANDPLNLLAVDGDTNQKKGDSDAASWLPPNKNYRCRYIARQIAVKKKYSLWITEAEKDAMGRILSGCPGQPLPLETLS